ncbi:hypothetical protein LCGC14_0249870 [marine sediment metagenome]|uniref:Uncharacterized protein n=1 Tax=marine sediment metagenome TaxID=412755 RepID=A0A0F9U9W8_9ZZZZ
MLDAKTKRFVRDQTEGMDDKQAAKQIQKLIPNYTMDEAREVVRESRYQMRVEHEYHAEGMKPWRVYTWDGHKEFQTKHETEAWMDDQENL